MNLLTEYLADLARTHAEELKFVGAIGVFVVLLIAIRIAQRG